MLPEIGHFSLIIAFCLSLGLSIIPIIGIKQSNQALMRLAPSFAVTQFCFVLLAFAMLAVAFAVNDFSVLYVAENSYSALPLIYRICAVWGAHEGSLLLWMLMLSAWMLAVVMFSKDLPLKIKTYILSIMGMICVGFLAFLLFTSNPFLRLLPNSPLNGQDLNPLLQDPGFVTHPPLLYFGYVGFAVVYAFAMTALITGEIDTKWVRWVRPWTLVAWSFLTAGITLGSWWSYRQLGWGGWWFWDPVENASFMPWLVGAALIHSLIVTEKRGIFSNWTILLALCSFSLSLLGTFLVRSGVLISVHAFAVDPKRGAFMLVYLGLVIGVSLTVFAFRSRQIKNNIAFSLLSREFFLLSNNMILAVAAATVLLGTLYPLILQALGLGKISVGAPYFNAVFSPLMVVLFLLMGIAPRVAWKSMPTEHLLKRLRSVLVICLSLALILPLVFTHAFNASASLALFCALWIVFGVLQSKARNPELGFFRSFSLPRQHYGMLLAHAGIAICLIGVVMTSFYQQTRTVILSPGETVTVSDYQFKFAGISHLQGANYNSIAANILITNSDGYSNLLLAEKRSYIPRNMALAKVAIAANLWRDLYVALGDQVKGDTWTFQIHFIPFVRWIWCGGLFILLGGLLAAFNRRLQQTKSVQAAVPEYRVIVGES